MSKRLAIRKNIFIPEGTVFETVSSEDSDKMYSAKIEVTPGHDIVVTLHESTFSELVLNKPPRPSFW